MWPVGPRKVPRRSRVQPTLVEALEARARADPGAEALVFEERPHTLGELWREVERTGLQLQAAGVRAGDRVVLVLPNGPGFFAAFFAAQRGGAVPVPLYPQSGAERVADLARACGATAALVPASASAAQRTALRRALGRATRLLVVGPEASAEGDRPANDAHDADGAGRRGAAPSARAAPGAPLRWPALRPDQPALIQYTSGSTAAPRGVVITHRQLATNVGQMIAGMRITARDVFVSFLPVHHDMGLILMALVPLALGARLVLLPSRLGDVRPWLAAIARHRGTFTAAPDFAYRLCLRAVRDPAAFDLGSLRVALNAAEPVRAETIRRFEQAFGLRRVMRPGYGLAEATVGVSMQPPGSAVAVSGRGLVAIGRPFPGVRIHVVAGRRPARPGEVGELLVRSPANSLGYYRAPRATRALFARPGCIRTGDLGYRDRRGRIFLVGRAKNVIIQAGRNLAPQELEEVVEALPFVRRAAAVGLDRGRAEGEQAWVFVELRRGAQPEAALLQELARQVVARVHERLGLRPGGVVLLRPRSLPLTANGKLRHVALGAAWCDGSLQAQGRVLFPAPWGPPSR